MIRVRFAPSPTGLMHIGNARTALINWLLMRHHQLKGEEACFLLRQDDTDTERSKEEYAAAIKEDLAWLGLTHHEFARQSDRFARYAELKTKLIESGRLYPCYETPEELEFKRRNQLAKGLPPIYDRASLKLTEKEKNDFEKSGRVPHWRFLLVEEDVSWNDLVRGPTVFQSQFLNDPVLVRADGAFLYTITSVIDDIDFNITHIIRGEDHVTNTAVQLQLFDALRILMGRDKSPLFLAHTTLLLDAEGGGLSKRLGSLSLRSLREEGIEPMAINSLLARLGTSLPVEPKLTLDELALNFDLSIFSRTPPRFDLQELKILSRKTFQMAPFVAVQEKIQKISPRITESHWLLLRGNLETLTDLSHWEKVFFEDIVFDGVDVPYIKLALETLPAEPWDTETWRTWTMALKEKTGRKGKELFMPLRHALTGFDHGPEMKDVILLMGHKLVTHRLKKY